MGCFQVTHNSRVVIYERKLFIRLATVITEVVIDPRSLSSKVGQRLPCS